MALRSGLTGRATLVVSDADTAAAVGSGDVPVLATPRVVALAEEATVRAVAAGLPAGATTVGTRVAFDHTAATGLGATVVADAVLTHVEGRQLRFEVRVFEVIGGADGPTVATGTVGRAVVDRERFLARLRPA